LRPGVVRRPCGKNKVLEREHLSLLGGGVSPSLPDLLQPVRGVVRGTRRALRESPRPSGASSRRAPSSGCAGRTVLGARRGRLVQRSWISCCSCANACRGRGPFSCRRGLLPAALEPVPERQPLAGGTFPLRPPRSHRLRGAGGAGSTPSTAHSSPSGFFGLLRARAGGPRPVSAQPGPSLRRLLFRRGGFGWRSDLRLRPRSGFRSSPAPRRRRFRRSSTGRRSRYCFSCLPPSDRLVRLLSMRRSAGRESCWPPDAPEGGFRRCSPTRGLTALNMAAKRLRRPRLQRGEEREQRIRGLRVERREAIPPLAPSAWSCARTAWSGVVARPSCSRLGAARIPRAGAGAHLPWPSRPLRNSVAEAAHVVQEEVRERW